MTERRETKKKKKKNNTKKRRNNTKHLRILKKGKYHSLPLASGLLFLAVAPESPNVSAHSVEEEGKMKEEAEKEKRIRPSIIAIITILNKMIQNEEKRTQYFPKTLKKKRKMKKASKKEKKSKRSLKTWDRGGEGSFQCPKVVP